MGRHSRYENGVVTTITGALMLGPDVEEARERIRITVAEARAAVRIHDSIGAERILAALQLELEGRIRRELGARIAEIKEGTRHAFGDLKVVAPLLVGVEA